MKNTLSVFSLFLLLSCYHTPKIEGFDPKAWNEAIESCSDYREKNVIKILNNKDQLLSHGQNSIQNILGKPSEHELYRRNKKFFFYNLTCEKNNEDVKRLSILFDALGRAQDIRVEVKP